MNGMQDEGKRHTKSSALNEDVKLLKKKNIALSEALWDSQDQLSKMKREVKYTKSQELAIQN